MGQSPQLVPPLILPVVTLMPEEQWARELIDQLHLDICEAQDNLLKAKIQQVAYANLMCGAEPDLKIGEKVMLSTVNRRQQYTSKGQKCVAKFMPHFDGPFLITDVNPEKSMVMLDLPASSKIFPMFHTSEVF